MSSAVAGGAGLLSLAACDPSAPDSSSTRGLDPSSWPSIRAQFRLAPGMANFTAFVFASHSAQVNAAIDRHRAGLDADPHGYLADNEAALDQAVLRAAAAYLDTNPNQIALTDSTTMGLGLLYTGLRLGTGDEVLTSEHDFYSTYESLRLRQVRDGVTVRRVRLYDDPATADAQEIARRLAAALGPATRAVALTWVHSSTGVKLPVRAIADVLAGVNATRSPDQRVLLCLDGVHGFGAQDATPTELGCDFLVSGCHKWLFGPRGTGLVWGTPQAWARLTPVIPSFAFDSIGAWIDGSVPAGPPGPAATPGGYHSFEHRWALTEAFGLHRSVGRGRIADRTQVLATALKDGLSSISKVRLRTPRSPQLSAGIVCCEVDGYSALSAVSRLRGANVLASTTPYATSYLRFGASMLTSESDIQAALRAVRAL
jgi:selenocysteine lyase/cysteine desulfurase